MLIILQRAADTEAVGQGLQHGEAVLPLCGDPRSHEYPAGQVTERVPLSSSADHHHCFSGN